MTVAPVLAAFILVVEGLGGVGLPPGRGMPREIALALYDGTAVSWRITPESTWRKPNDRAAFHVPNSPKPPGVVAKEIADYTSGRTVVARDAKATKKYLDRLLAAGGVERRFDIMDFDTLALEFRMPPVTFAALPGLMHDLSLLRDVAVAAQTASAFLLFAAKNDLRADANAFVDAET
jgi:hypothetical protein